MAFDITGQKIEVGDIIVFSTDILKSVYSGIYTGCKVRAMVHRIEELHADFSYLEIILAPGFEYALDMEDITGEPIKIFANVVALVPRNEPTKDTNKDTNIEHQGIIGSFFSGETEFDVDKI